MKNEIHFKIKEIKYKKYVCKKCNKDIKIVPVSDKKVVMLCDICEYALFMETELLKKELE